MGGRMRRHSQPLHAAPRAPHANAVAVGRAGRGGSASLWSTTLTQARRVDALARKIAHTHARPAAMVLPRPPEPLGRPQHHGVQAGRRYNAVRPLGGVAAAAGPAGTRARMGSEAGRNESSWRSMQQPSLRAGRRQKSTWNTGVFGHGRRPNVSPAHSMPILSCMPRTAARTVLCSAAEPHTMRACDVSSGHWTRRRLQLTCSASQVIIVRFPAITGPFTVHLRCRCGVGAAGSLAWGAVCRDLARSNRS